MEKMEHLMESFCNHVPFHDLEHLSHNTDWYRLIDIALESVLHQSGKMDYDMFFECIKEHYGINDETIDAYGIRAKLEQLITTLNYLKGQQRLVD